MRPSWLPEAHLRLPAAFGSKVPGASGSCGETVRGSSICQCGDALTWAYPGGTQNQPLGFFQYSPKIPRGAPAGPSGPSSLSGGGRSQGRAEQPQGAQEDPCAGGPLTRAALRLRIWPASQTPQTWAHSTSIRLSLSQRRYELVRHPWLGRTLQTGSGLLLLLFILE